MFNNFFSEILCKIFQLWNLNIHNRTDTLVNINSVEHLGFLYISYIKQGAVGNAFLIATSVHCKYAYCKIKCNQKLLPRINCLRQVSHVR